MGIRGEVFSARTSTANGNRTYFFNVKENRNGDLFLNIVESKKQEEAERFERRSVIVFDEDIDLFFEQFKKAYEFIKKNS
jgi:hypothetical protein